MSTYLYFSSIDYRFLLPPANIVELYDADASPEPLDAVLSGDNGAVYWRDNLSSLMDINVLVGKEASKNNRCFVVCKGCEGDAVYYILRVHNIHDLLELDDSGMRHIHIECPLLSAMTQRVCIVPGEQKLYFVLKDVQAIISNPVYCQSAQQLDCAVSDS